jgi:carboxymethylenebutenolidase
MKNGIQNQERSDKPFGDLSRRNFVTASVAAGFGVAAPIASNNASPVIELDVEIKTPDGVCDAVLAHPAKGRHPGVLVWPDSGSLRPAFREIAKRLAGEGYVALVPNHLYREAKAPVFSKDFNPGKNRADAAFYRRVTASHFAPGAVERDANAFVAFLDAQQQVNKKKKIGVVGYCLGGGYVLKTAAAFPDRVGAGVSFHGGLFFKSGDDSPHLVIPKIKARLYFAVASEDDQREPEVKDKLKTAFAAAKALAEIEVYPNTPHGWCVPDDSKAAEHKAEADRAWGKLIALYKSVL